MLLRAVPALFAAGSAAVTCLLAKELGGSRFAQGLAALAGFLCPVLMSFGTKVSPDMFGLVLWPLIALLILRLLRGQDPRLWLVAGLALGLSFEAKYSVLFYAVGLLLGLLLTQDRKALWSPWCLGGILLAAVLALPNALWQLHNDFPMLELLRNGQNGKNVALSPGGFIAVQFLITNPVLAVVWVVGLGKLMRMPQARFLAVAFLVLMVEMMALHGKHYYPANIYPVLFAAGGVAVEAWTRRLPTLRPWLVGCVLAAGAVMVPYVLPILPVETFVRFNQALGPILHMDAAKTERHGDSPLPQDFADMHGWPELTAAVARVYAALSPEERSQAVVAAQNYGEAAAIEFFGKAYSLPPVISGHNQYYLWGTQGKDGAVLIDVHGDCAEKKQLYASAVVATTFQEPYVMPYENGLKIMVCRGLKRPLSEIWPSVRFYR